MLLNVLLRARWLAAGPLRRMLSTGLDTALGSVLHLIPWLLAAADTSGVLEFIVVGWIFCGFF